MSTVFCEIIRVAAALAVPVQVLGQEEAAATPEIAALGDVPGEGGLHGGLAGALAGVLIVRAIPGTSHRNYHV